MKEPLLLIGAGGHCRSCIDVIEAEGRFRIAGLVDIPDKVGQTILNYRVLGSDEDLPALVVEYGNCLITIGQIKSAKNRAALYEVLTSLGAVLPVPVSPLAYVSPHASVGAGSMVMHQALVNAGARIGYNCIINSKALIEHDAVIGDHCHVATGAVVNGDCRIGTGVFLGSNSCCRQGVVIGNQAVISAGVFVNEDVPSGAIVRHP